jgi:glycerol-3-phosphate acyltransferase PlsY
MVDAMLVLLSYLLGSIPFAYIAGRWLRGIDIRKVGDGNVGAANAYREIGAKAGIAVLVADVGKGALAASITSILASQPIVLLAGIGAVAGHNWPLYIGFKGGRGESTAIGVLSVLFPQPMLILLAICAVPFLVTRNTMVAGVILFSPLWLVALLTGASAALVGYSIGLPCLVGLTHFLTTKHLPEEARQTINYMQ